MPCLTDANAMLPCKLIESDGQAYRKEGKLIESNGQAYRGERSTSALIEVTRRCALALLLGFAPFVADESTSGS